MQCAWFNRQRVKLITVCGLPIVLGCAAYGETPPDQLDLVTDAVETRSTFVARQIVQNFPRLGDAVVQAFQHTAAMKPDFHETHSDIDPSTPYNPSYPDWPNPDTDITWYQNFAANNHDTSQFPWIVYYVQHTVANTSTACHGGSTGWGAAFSEQPTTPNTVFTNPALRFSFVFVTDIQVYEQTYCLPPDNTPDTDEQFENFVITVVTHEFGHQRAGLTDKDLGNNAAAYHQGGLPQGRADVMSYNAADARNHGDPVFDATSQEQPGGPPTTCRANLLNARSTH